MVRISYSSGLFDRKLYRGAFSDASLLRLAHIGKYEGLTSKPA